MQGVLYRVCNVSTTTAYGADILWDRNKTANILAIQSRVVHLKFCKSVHPHRTTKRTSEPTTRPPRDQKKTTPTVAHRCVKIKDNNC